MPHSRLLAGACALAAIVGAAAAAPSHPTVLQADHEGRVIPVCAAKGENPVGLIDGQPHPLGPAAALTTARAAAYAEGSATIRVLQSRLAPRDVSTQFIYGNGTIAHGGPVRISSLLIFNAVITADRDLDHGYLALLSCDPDYLAGRTESPQLDIRLHELPRLKAGEPRTVRLALRTGVGSGTERSVVPLMFSEGREIRTNHAPEVAALFARGHHRLHEVARAEWLARHSGRSAEPVPFIQAPPVFTGPAAIGETQARLTIGADGTVTSVALADHLPAATHQALREAVESWLFLPRLRNGQPVASTAAVTIRL